MSSFKRTKTGYGAYSTRGDGPTVLAHKNLTDRRLKKNRKQNKGKYGSSFAKQVHKVILRSAEPKRWVNAVYGQSVAQLSGATASGHNVNALTYPTVGTGSSQRIGQRFTLTGITFGMQTYMQNGGNGLRVKYALVYYTGGSYTTFNIEDYLQYNYAVSNASVAVLGGGPYKVYDTQIRRGLDHMDEYTTMKAWDVDIDPMQYSASANIASVNDSTYIAMAGGGLEIEIDIDTGYPVNGSLHLVALGSRGNSASGTASTLLGVPQRITSSGAFFNFNAVMHFKDL